MSQDKDSLSFQNNIPRVSCIDLELIIILAFVIKDTLKRCYRDTRRSNANSTGASETLSTMKQLKVLCEGFTFSLSTPCSQGSRGAVNLEKIPLKSKLAISVILKSCVSPTMTKAYLELRNLSKVIPLHHAMVSTTYM